MKNEKNKNLIFVQTYKYGQFYDNLGCNCIKELFDKNEYTMTIHECSNHETQFFSKDEYIVEIRKKMKK